MCFEWIKYISPLIGVGMGALLVPWIERKKSDEISKTSLRNFFSEVEEWYQDLDCIAKGTYQTYRKAQRIESGETIEDDELYPISLGKKIKFLTIDDVLSNSFTKLSFDQRKAIRAIIALADSINSKQAVALSADIKAAPARVKGKAAFMTREIASLYYVLSRLHHEKERFKYLDLSNEQVREKGLAALEITL